MWSFVNCNYPKHQIPFSEIVLKHHLKWYHVTQPFTPLVDFAWHVLKNKIKLTRVLIIWQKKLFVFQCKKPKVFKLHIAQPLAHRTLRKSSTTFLDSPFIRPPVSDLPILLLDSHHLAHSAPSRALWPVKETSGTSRNRIWRLKSRLWRKWGHLTTTPRSPTANRLWRLVVNNEKTGLEKTPAGLENYRGIGCLQNWQTQL